MKFFQILRVVRKTWEKFLQATSMPGLANAGKEQTSILRRVIWLIAFTIMFYVSLCQIINIVKEYFTYPVTTKVTVMNSPIVFFPAVTICNQNRINCCNLVHTMGACRANYSYCGFKSNKDEQFQLLDTMMKECTTEEPILEVKRTKRESNNKPKAASSRPDYGVQTTEVKEAEEFLMKYMGLSENVRQLIGHDFNDFIKMCTFRGSTCLESKLFLLRSNPEYGNCFTFNSNYNREDPLAGNRTSTHTGPIFGLSVVLNLNQKRYLLNGATQKAGARITVHDSALRGLVEEDGLDVAPAQSTSISIQETVKYRQKSPYTSKCMHDWNETPYSEYLNMHTSGRYSIAECKRICFFKTVLETCNCFDPHFLDFDKNKNGYNPCNQTQDAVDEICIEQVVHELETGIRNCSCRIDCLERKYPIQLSTAVWPSKQYIDDAADEFGFTNDAGTDSCIDTSLTAIATSNVTSKGKLPSSGVKSSTEDSDVKTQLLAENLLRFDIYFQTLNVQNISESPTYDSYTLMSSLGGAASLYLGLATYMILEVIEFIIDVGLNLLAYCIKGNS